MSNMGAERSANVITPTDTARLREDLAWIARHPYNNRAKYTAVNSLPALLDEVDRLRARVADAERALGRLADPIAFADDGCAPHAETSARINYARLWLERMKP